MFHIFIFVLFSYLIAGVSTTDIVRLTAGRNESLFTMDSFCPNCGYSIPLHNQLPIISHLLNKGHCKNCNAKIPLLQFILEIGIFLSNIGIAFFFHYQSVSYLVIWGWYEVVKIVVVLFCGPRNEHFFINFVISVGVNALLFVGGFLFSVVIHFLGL